MTVYIIFTVIAFAVLVASIIIAFKKNKKGGNNPLMGPIQTLIAGDYVSVVAMFIPIYYVDYFKGWECPIIRPFILSLHNALRVFIMDGEFDIVMEHCESFPAFFRWCYTVVFAFLYLLSPVLTLGFVLSLFKNVFSEFRFNRSKRRDTFIMSALNERSLALARSIKAKYAANKTKCKIVFTSVSTDYYEEKTELIAEANKLDAICFPDEITEGRIGRAFGRVEFFVLGDNESENISEALQLIDKFKLRPNTKVFLFSEKEAAGIMLDSAKKTELLEAMPASDFPRKDAGGSISNDRIFTARRVNVIENFAIKAVEDADLYKTTRAESNGDKVISVMLLGLGRHGSEILKTVLWYTQMIGYKLEVNVVDRTSGPRGAVARFLHSCPEIMSMNDLNQAGEEKFSIRFYEGIDVAAGGLDWIYTYDGSESDKLEMIERFARTGVMYITLGNDEVNIQTGIEMRRFMDRLNLWVAKKTYPLKNVEDLENAAKISDMLQSVKNKDDLPAIYSIVYDEHKSELLKGIGGLVDYKGVSYNITFIGSLDEIYAYDAVFREEMETTAYVYHIDWMAKDTDPSKFKEEYINYENYEYFRNSSFAQAVHKKMAIANDFISTDKEREATIEHMRWNAYIRTHGYMFPGSSCKLLRNDRAKLHNCLVNFSYLSDTTKAKDVKVNK